MSSYHKHYIVLHYEAQLIILWVLILIVHTYWCTKPSFTNRTTLLQNKRADM